MHLFFFNFNFFFFLICCSKKNEYAKKPWSDRPELAVWFFCVWSLMKDPLLHEKRSAVVEGEMEKGEREREKKSPSLALLEISTKEGDGGRVKQADCLESNKTRRLRGPGSSFGSFD